MTQENEGAHLDEEAQADSAPVDQERAYKSRKKWKLRGGIGIIHTVGAAPWSRVKYPKSGTVFWPRRLPR